VAAGQVPASVTFVQFKELSMSRPPDRVRARPWIVACVLAIGLTGGVAAGQDVDRYREFTLGMSVAAVSALTGAAGLELTAPERSPAAIRQLTWRPRYSTGRTVSTELESVDEIAFDFHEDRLFRVTVGYARLQTEGLTDADMLSAISLVYGAPLSRVPSLRAMADTTARDPGTRVASWGNEVNSVVLYRIPSTLAIFRLIVTDEASAARAQTVAARAAALDAQMAPEREAARERKAAEERRAAEEKARQTNKATFRP